MANPTEAQKIEADIQKVYTFTKSHLVLAALLALAIFGCIHLYDARQADKADATAATSAAIAKEKDAENAQLQQQNAALQAQLAANEAQQEQTAAALIAAAKAIQASTQQQVNKIPTLPPSQLAVQWGAAAQEPAPAIDAAGMFQVPLPLAQKSTVALIEVPSLTSQNEKLTDANTALNGALSDADKQLDSEKAAHLGDNQTCAADKKALQDEVVKVKKDARRRSLKYMLLGGFIVEAARIYLGHP